MMDRSSGKLIAKITVCFIFVALCVNIASLNNGVQNNSSQIIESSLVGRESQDYLLPMASALVEDPILNSLEKGLIIENSQIANALATQIIDSVNSGSFYYGYWEPSLESVCAGLSVLKSINAINTIDATRVANYIIAQFDEQSCLFIDSSTGFLNYSYNKLKFSSSPIESTAYAIVALDSLNKLDQLSTAQKDQIILNMQASVNRFDGGFCHRIDGVKPTGFENSSIRLSYWMYTALDILEPDQLTSEQITNLTRFIKNQQYHGVGIYIFDGSFKDSYITAVPSIETCYSCKNSGN
jgi:prenyltransferase beta subunit